jgi:RNA polymerase sigma-70 factor, ECF subfamily
MNITGRPVPGAASAGGVAGTSADASLVAAIAAGDRDAMRILYNRHRIRVFRFAARLVGDIAATEDVVSEAFIEVWRQADRFEGRSSVSTWIMSIARFKALSVRRRRPNMELDLQAAETVVDFALTPEQVVLETDRRSQLRICLGRLSPDHRAIIDLVYYHDKTIEEVAEIVGAPKNTVKTRMFYARKRLAWLLSRHDDFDYLASDHLASDHLASDHLPSDHPAAAALKGAA